MATKEKSINHQFDKLTLSDEFKFDDELLDDALINGMKGEHKSFCLQVESFLNTFVTSNKTTEIIGNLDKYQRKIVHKICDIYRVKREYVDVKTNDRGDITISKTEDTKLPGLSLEERFNRHQEETKKLAPKQIVNPIANKKLLIKPRENKKTGSESDSSDSSSNENSQKESKDTKDDLEQQKQKEYEKARAKIMQEQPETTSNPKVIEKPKKKGLRVDQFYDPDYDRNKDIPVINNTGFYPPQFNAYYPYQGYPQSQVPFTNGFQPGYGAPGVIVSDDNRFGYQNNFPSLQNDGNNMKKK